jgi:hypothetical protein
MDLNLTNAVAATSGNIWWWILGIAAVVGLIWWWSAASGHARAPAGGRDRADGAPAGGDQPQGDGAASPPNNDGQQG